jgi:hypothetical protein
VALGRTPVDVRTMHERLIEKAWILEANADPSLELEEELSSIVGDLLPSGIFLASE